MKKSSKFSMFSSKKKKTLLTISSGLLSVIGVTTGWVLSNAVSSVNNSIVKVDSSLNGLNPSTTTTQTQATFTVTTQQNPLNKTADQVTTSDLESVLSASSTIQSFTVVILPATEKNINQGYVNFLIYETYYNGTANTTVFADASQSKNNDNTTYQTADTIDTTTLGQYTINGSTPTATNVFSTAKITNLSNWITATKYNLVWKTDDQLKAYITSSTSTSLTTDMVWNNLLDSTSNLPDLVADGATPPIATDPYTTITITSVNANGDTVTAGSDIGLYKVELKIYNTTTAGWEDGAFPIGAQNDNSTLTITKYFGGFLASNGQRYDVSVVPAENIRNWTIANVDLFDGATANTDTVSMLKPSEFCSPMGGTSALISLFSSGTGLSNNTETTPIVQYSYNGQSFKFYDPASTSSGSSSTSGGVLGLINSNNTQIKINSIVTTPNDADGSLKLIFNYNGFSIYSGSVVPQTYTLEFPAGTFATSSTTENSILTWKDVNTLSDYGLSSTYDIVNEFMNNQDNAEFVRLFTNQFLDASSYVQSLNRTASIRFGTPATPDAEVPESNNIFNATTGLYTSGASDSTSVTVRLTFDDWNGSGESKVFQQSFSFPYYQYTYDSTTSSVPSDDSITFTWKSNSAVLTANPTFANTTPSNIIYNLLTSATTSTTYPTIFTNLQDSSLSNLNISLIPDDVNGSILVFVSRQGEAGTANSNLLNAHIYSQLFTGFKKSSETSSLVSYSWLPNEDVSMDLLSIPLASVTKADVINYYLKNISLFQDSTLTENNVTISPNLTDYTLTVQVTIPLYNQDSIVATNRVFTTKLSGFVQSTYTNDTTFSPPKNLTAVFAISAATIVSIALGVVLLTMLLRRARIRNFKGYHSEILGDSKPRKEKKVKIKK